VDAHLVTTSRRLGATGAAKVVAALSVTALLVAGCQSGGVTDKTGGNVIVLRLATIDNLNPNGQLVAPGAFITALSRLSRGRIKTTVQNVYGDGAVTAETDLIKAIATGDLDAGWPTTRSFSRAGIRGLEPVEAPFMITNYSAQKALATGPESVTLLNTLNGSGVVGLGLTVGPLRRPWAIGKPLLDVQRWQGVTFRSYNSPVQDATTRALGAVPVPASFAFPTLVHAGHLRGVELDVAQYSWNHYGTLLPNAVANEVLWPRMGVLTMNQKRFDSLTAEQQRWVRGAAQEAVQASVDFEYDEETPAKLLCRQGVRFYRATPQQLDSLQQAVRPVLDELARDPATAPSLSVVKSVAARFPSPESLDVAASCRRR
jgi:TRAP-type C4-dicarboxylate transport system substrate-binding protein